MEDSDIENDYSLLGRDEDEQEEDIKPNGDDEENNYFLLSNEDEDTKEKSGQEKRDNEEESDYALLTDAEVAHGNEMVKAVYHVLEKPGNDDNDYADPDDEDLFQRSFQKENGNATEYEVPCVEMRS